MRLTGTPLRAGSAAGRAHVRNAPPEPPGEPGPALDTAPPGGAGRILCASGADAAAELGPESPWGGAVVEAARWPSLSAVGPPIVGRLEPDIFREEDPIEIDGGVGRVELAGVREVRVVTSFIEREDHRLLLLRRSAKVGSFQGRWAGVSGYLETDEPLDQALTEIREETGISSAELTLLARGRMVYARDGDRVFAVHPFRFRARAPTVRLDWEHSELAWVDPAEVPRRETVPKLDRVLRAVLDDNDPAVPNP